HPDRMNCRSHVDYFAGSGVMQLLPGFFLNGLGISLECFDLRGVAVVFLLQCVNFVAESLVLRPLLAIDDHAVSAEHHMKEEPDGKQGDRRRCQAAPSTTKPAECRPEFLHNLAAKGFGLRSMIDQCA